MRRAPAGVCWLWTNLFAQEFAVSFARPSLFFDRPSNRLDSRLEVDQICTRHFLGMIDGQHFAQSVDLALKITAGLVTCRGFMLAKLG